MSPSRLPAAAWTAARSQTTTYAFSYKRVNPEEKNNYFVDIYKFILDFVDNDVKVQPEEVEGFKIATLEEVQAFAKEGIFLHYDSMKEVFD